MTVLARRFHKLSYYLESGVMELYPGFLRRVALPRKLEPARLPSAMPLDMDAIAQRVNYYNKLPMPVHWEAEPVDCSTRMEVGTFRKTGSSVYYYDLAPLIRHFPRQFWFYFLPGDITHVPDYPALLKSRPVGDDNQHSVLLKLNSVRHYYYEKDPYTFAEKLPKLVWRGADFKPHRQAFLAQYYNAPFCDAGSVGNKNSEFKKDFMSITEQCRYKYIMSIEGNDVATNLKWIFRSNSVCFMRKPRFETWFMEGRLQPNVHYIELKDDFSDVAEKIAFCEENPELVQSIIRNANDYVQQFDNKKQEELISLLVLKKYFEATRQM